MTILFIVLVLALISLGGLVYAANETDSITIEKADKINTDSMVKVQKQAIDSLKDEINKIKSSNDSDRSSLRVYLFIGLVCIVIFILLFVLAFLTLAEKASKKRVNFYYKELNTAIYKTKEEFRGAGQQSKSSSKQEFQQRKTNGKGGKDQRYQGYERRNTDVTSSQQHSQSIFAPKPEKKPIEKVVYLKNNEGDVFISISEQQQETSTFKVIYNPEDKFNFGELHVIGKIDVLKVMKKESRDCSIKLVKSSCDWNEASEYTQDHAGQVRRDGDFWTILIPVEIILKK